MKSVGMKADERYDGIYWEPPNKKRAYRIGTIKAPQTMAAWRRQNIRWIAVDDSEQGLLQVRRK